MSDEGTPADVYHLKGRGIELTYRRSDSKTTSRPTTTCSPAMLSTRPRQWSPRSACM